MKTINTFIMSPRLNRIMLTTHITVSVGWFGAVAVFLALAITGIATVNAQLFTGGGMGYH